MGTSTSSSLSKLLPIILIILLISTLAPIAHSQSDECGGEITNACINKSKATPLKIIAIVTIFITSMIGVSLPLMTRAVPALNPERSLFVIIKCFASGIILATGFMHVLPDSFDSLNSNCLPDKPWHKFPFSGFVAMISAIITLMVDAMATSIYTRQSTNGIKPDNIADDVAAIEAGAQEMTVPGGHGGHFHSHHHQGFKEGGDHVKLTRYRVTAMVLELGIIVHSIVIGLSMGASNNTCSIKGLVAALCFHQMFEGMGLGGCILQANYKSWKNAAMVFFFSTTTPFGIGLGMAISGMYKENSPSSLATVGLLNASSAGLLIYMALVDLLAADFMGPKLQGSIKLQIKSFIAILLGAGGMSILAKWA